VLYLDGGVMSARSSQLIPFCLLIGNLACAVFGTMAGHVTQPLFSAFVVGWMAAGMLIGTED
jgi:hypothetical protein